MTNKRILSLNIEYHIKEKITIEKVENGAIRILKDELDNSLWKINEEINYFERIIDKMFEN